MSTKKRRCKLPSGTQPNRAEYTKMTGAALVAVAVVRVLFRRAKVAKDEPLPPPHTWPPYLGPCWQQAYQEAIALRVLADAYTALENAKKSKYMPANVLAGYIAAYNAAKTNYLLAWQAMEDCLNLIV